MEVVSLLVLAVALGVKFATSKHVEALEVEKAEVDHERDRLEASHAKALENKAEAENRLRLFQHERAELEKRLDLAQKELEALVERTRELEED